MLYGSVCSGIEAVSLAWEPLGFMPAWFAEIDPFCSALLQHRFPDVTNHGDFTRIEPGGQPIDILVGGTPCQSFSVAGRRGGLDDARGNLALEYCRLADRLRPRWIVWENVPGVLSSNRGRDFGALVGALAELGYGCAWRVLDAQHFGVPQRRRRVFLVGRLGDWRGAAAVLFDREGLHRNPAPRGQSGREIAKCLGRSSAGSSADRGDGSFNLIPTAAAVFEMSGHRSRPTEVAATLDAGCKNGPMRNQVATAVLSAFRMARFDRYEADETASTLMARNFKAATDLVAFSCKDCGADAHKELSPTLRAMNHSASHANAGGQVAIAFNQGNLCRGHGPRPSDKVFQTLRTHAGDNRACVATRLAVRRLTPRECERLQGMPDDWTLVPYRGKPAADAPRYKAVGNSMAVCVMRWIGRRLLAVDQRKF